MFFILKFAPEMIIKSKPVRKQMAGRLHTNLRRQFKAASLSVEVVLHWDKVTVKGSEDGAQEKQAVLDILRHTSGIAHILDVEDFAFEGFDETAAHCVRLLGDKIAEGTFVVRCKRTGQHDFTSHELEQQVGGRLLAAIPSAKVNLKQPDYTVKLELIHDRLYVISERIQGMGGFPMGEVEPVLSLISGGFDSSVSSYLTMRRGMPTHFCFFNLGGKAHEIAVKEIAYYLWQHFGSGRRVTFFSVPFEGVVAEILSKVSDSQMGVVLKRMMMRAASRLAEKHEYSALVTGEAVAQVSSQTLINLSVIDKVCDALVLRPLITSDKEDIIATARKIGTEAFSAAIPEYCGVISVKPTTRARLSRIEAEEANMDLGVLDRALEATRMSAIDALGAVADTIVDIREVDRVSKGDVVIDVRHPNDVEYAPLVIDGMDVLTVPFYSLGTWFEGKDKGRAYWLFCDKGVMSRLHAGHLADEGFQVGVFQPPKES